MHNEIIDAKKLVEDMTYGLQFYKDQEKKSKQIDKINKVIKLINLADRLSTGSEEMDVMNVLILHLFKEKYKAAGLVGDYKGFVSEVWFKMSAQAIGFDLKLGYDNIKEQLALQLSSDMLGNATFLTDEEKEGNVFDNPKVAKMFGDVKEMWMDNVQSVVEIVHSIRTEKYINGVT
jgi:hypothetical protein